MAIFCEYHIKTKENPEGTDCSADMAGSRCFRCPYTMGMIKYDPKNTFTNKDFYIVFPGFEPPNKECQDFRLPKDIAAKVENIPDDKKIDELAKILILESP